MQSANREASATGLVGETAAIIATRVRAGDSDPVDIVRAHLERIASADPDICAFQLVRGERAVADARELAARPDIAHLPLAGVPIAIKDNVSVAGEPMRSGSPLTPDAPRAADHEVVRRLRAAGAIVVGITRMPELGIWATSDGAFGEARNPWDLALTPGGSSGGSAAAVAAGMVPVAHGNDGLGSIRIPAACCGLFGIKPGYGVAPSGIGPNGWFGMAENGALTTTVTDAALMLAVLAYRSDLLAPEPPAKPLRIALSTRAPLPATRVNREYRAAAEHVAERLAREGHHVERADPPYALRNAMPVLARWFAGAALDAESLPFDRLERRTQTHVRLGRTAMRMRWVRAADALWWRQRAARFFHQYDVLITPALASPPLPAMGWHRRSWIANLASNTMYAPFEAPWNLAGFPACAVPATMHSIGLPASVQLVAPPGGEGTLLAVARQIELIEPWPRHAPADARHKRKSPGVAVPDESTEGSR